MFPSERGREPEHPGRHLLWRTPNPAFPFWTSRNLPYHGVNASAHAFVRCPRRPWQVGTLHGSSRLPPSSGVGLLLPFCAPHSSPLTVLAPPKGPPNRLSPGRRYARLSLAKIAWPRATQARATRRFSPIRLPTEPLLSGKVTLGRTQARASQPFCGWL